ncbi:MAG: nitrous oxide reductase accessory protein NosL [Arcobacteraceae bacterium]|nr:nitrous oxide reductase accessory protein NosL [Arcobacteraceae bacterium]
MRKLLLSLLTISALLVSASLSVQAMQKDGASPKKASMKMYRMVPKGKAALLQDGKNKAYCPTCGMTLPMFYKTNHAAKHAGHNKQYCSIVCLVEDAIVNGTKLTDFKVVDNSTLKFIDSKKAFFVVGSKKPGTMSVVSKYAFGTKGAADKFAAANGGKVMKFDALYKLVVNSSAKDMAATKKRQAMAIKKGAMMYKKMCKKTDKKFASTADAKSFLIESGICGKIKGKKHQAIALYLNSRK